MDDPHAEDQAWTHPALRPDALGVWRTEVVQSLHHIAMLLTQLVESAKSPVEQEPVAVRGETSEDMEPLPTWILDDQRVALIEQAIEQEQRVRGQAYGW